MTTSVHTDGPGVSSGMFQSTRVQSYGWILNLTLTEIS